MTFNDIFKSSFLDNASSFSPMDFLLAMALSFALGLFIFFVYKKTFNGVMYSANFGISLLGLTMITTMVILAVTSNVVLSLGMVGALSIVRFRTAIKEPMDIVFLFWAIAAGIVLGAGLIPLAVLSSAFIGLILWIYVNRKDVVPPFIIIITCHNEEAEKAAVTAVKEAVKKYMLKSKTVSSNGIELTLEVRLKSNDSDFINRISALPGVENVVMVSYNGDYMG